MSELPEGWSRVSLGDLGDWRGGGTPSKRVAGYWNGDIPWVSPKDMKVGQIRDTINHISKAAVEESATNVVPASSVLVVTRSGILAHSLPVATTEQRVALNQDLKALVPAGAVDSEYVAWALRSKARAILDECSKAGTTVASIDTARLLDFRVPLAPLNEQRRIVAAIEEHLSRLDAADASLAAARTRLNSLRSSELRGALDDDWPTAKLGDVAVSVRNGLFVSRPAVSPPGIPIFRISAVRPMTLDIEDVRYADIAHSQAAPYLTQEDDLLFTRYSGNPEYVGACARVPRMDEPALHPDKLIRVVIDRERAEPAFVEMACAAGVTRDEIRLRRKTTAGQVGIAGGQLKTVPIPLPPLDEQRRIVAQVEEQLSAIDMLRAAIERAQRRSASLRRAVLERAFRGELVPQDPTDEPAETLLARIRAERATAAAPDRRRRSTGK